MKRFKKISLGLGSVLLSGGVIAVSLTSCDGNETNKITLSGTKITSCTEKILVSGKDNSERLEDFKKLSLSKVVDLIKAVGDKYAKVSVDYLEIIHVKADGKDTDITGEEFKETESAFNVEFKVKSGVANNPFDEKNGNTLVVSFKKVAIKAAAKK